MEVLIDLLLVWALFPVCIKPILLAIQIATNIRWYKKFHEGGYTIMQTRHLRL